MYIHRNTLVYRLERVQKMTGLDVRRFEDADEAAAGIDDPDRSETPVFTGIVNSSGRCFWRISKSICRRNCVEKKSKAVLY